MWLARPLSGQALVEAAVTLPILLLTALGLIQFALYVHAEQVVTGAVQDGARVAAAEGASTAEGVARARTLIDGTLGNGVASVAVTGGATTDVVVISANGRLSTIVPWPGDGIPLSATARVNKERLVPSGR